VLLDGLGEYKSAIVRLKKSLNDGVDDRKAVLQLLVSIYRKLDIPEKEVIYLKKLLDYGNKDVYERIQKLYCQINRADKAIQVLKKALNRNLKDPSLFESIGWLCLRENHIAEGLDYMEKAYSLDSQSKQVRNKLIHALSLAATTKEQCKAILMDAGR
jgi:tetratricopeptide (TPR) repeat protein